MVDPQTVLGRLDQVRAETLRRLDGLTQEQLDWRPPQAEGEEEWSLGEVFMHLAIDEFYLRELIARPLLEGIKPPDGIRFLPPPPPYGTTKEVIRFWFQRARLQTHRFFEAWPSDANLDLTHEGGLEAMNGLEWFQGYAGHEAFHHQQIDRLIAQLALIAHS
ncbi:MAG TPA: DinB family protein [Anaerolineae bacterium]|nr:DinB family protein [Anaerolineae bacterium]